MSGSPARLVCRHFNATKRPTASSQARYTTPMPPSPSTDSIRYTETRVPLPSRIGGKPLRVEPASSSGSEAAFPLAALLARLPLAGPLVAPLPGEPLAGLPLAGLPLAGLPLAGLPLAGLLLAAAVGSVPASHAG